MLDVLIFLALASIGTPLQAAPAPAPAASAAAPAQEAKPDETKTDATTTEQTQAQDPQHAVPEHMAHDHDEATPPPPTPPTVKTVFKNLRFEEDWSALDNPDATTDHWFPGIKQIHLDGEGDWTASFGGQLRYQFKSEENRSLLGTVPGNNDFNLLRVRLFGELRYRDSFRFFVEGISAGIHGNDAAPLAIDRQSPDFLNAFVEFGDKDLLARLGRFEMAYGAQRLISPLEWANTRRTFQGGLFRTVNDAVTTDVFVTQSVNVDATDLDNADNDRHFSGIYNNVKLGEGTGVDLYALALNDTSDGPPFPAVPAGGPPNADTDTYTVGGRYFGKNGPVDYEAEAAKQFGNRNGLSVDAYMWTVVGGYTLADVMWTPRFAVDVDYASGDSDVADGDYETFNQLFPLGHAYFGYIDLIGRQNIMSIMPSVTMKTTSTTTFRASWSEFELADDSDFLYNASGAIVGGQTAATTLDTGDDVGHEVDLTLGWKPVAMAPHGEFLFGYSWFDPGSFVNGWGDGENVNLLYAQYLFTF